MNQNIKIRTLSILLITVKTFYKMILIIIQNLTSFFFSRQIFHYKYQIEDEEKKLGFHVAEPVF
jgi:hypothetical protein